MSSEKTRPMVQSPPQRSNQGSGDRRVRHGRRRNFHHSPRPKEHPLEKHNIRAESTKHDSRSTEQRNNSEKNARKSGSGSPMKKSENAKPKERPMKARKVYRRKKIFRKWVLLTVFLVPLGIIWLECYIGKLIGLEDIRDTYEDQLMDPWDLLRQDFNVPRIRERGGIYPLPKMAYAPHIQCPPGQRRMINVHNSLSHSVGSGEFSAGRLIPMIVHQQSKTRCLTMKVDRATTKWALKRVRNSEIRIF